MALIWFWYDFDMSEATRGYIKNVARALYQTPALIRLICFHILWYSYQPLIWYGPWSVSEPSRVISKRYQRCIKSLICFWYHIKTHIKTIAKTIGKLDFSRSLPFGYALGMSLMSFWYAISNSYQGRFDIVWYSFDTRIKLYQSISKQYQNALWHKCLI